MLRAGARLARRGLIETPRGVLRPRLSDTAVAAVGTTRAEAHTFVTSSCTLTRTPRIVATGHLVPAVATVHGRNVHTGVSRDASTGAEAAGAAGDGVTVPAHASVVIVGGGVIGSSVAYHLSKLGRTDVVLLEQNQLTSGTTWHAAGLIGLSRSSDCETRLCEAGSRLYEVIEQETEQATGYKRCGAITVARTRDRMHALRRTASRNKAFGVACEVVGPDDCGRLWDPQGVGLMRTDDLQGGLWIPDDGSASPTDLTMSLIKGAKSRGVKVFEHTRVDTFETATVNGQRRAAGVTTNRGRIECDVIVLCGGQWSRELGRQAGVSVPLHSAEHFYMITAPMEGVNTHLPIMRDLDAFTYFREWSGGLCMGGFEPDAKPVFTDGVPADFAFSLFPDDWDHFDVLLQGAMHRVPALETADVQSMVNGPESFTSDTRYILGEAPELRNFFVAAGMNSSGIAGAGGAGMAIAEWIQEGEPSMDLWAVDIRRFGAFHDNKTFLRDRISETLGLHYAMPWPTREHKSGRNLRRSPLNATLNEQGAQWGEKFGWERPNFFAPGASADEVARLKEYSWGMGNWMERVGAEARACRDSVAVFDQSSFAKFLVQGRDACQVLNNLCANQVDVASGTVVYTGMLNRRGGFEADVTVTRVSEDQYFVVSPTAQATRDLDWMRRNTPEDARCYMTDVSGAYATISVMGPRSRELLQHAAPSGQAHVWDDASFPFGTAKDVEVGLGVANARRITYVGELGWELYVRTEAALTVYEAIKNAAAAMGLGEAGAAVPVDAGYMAIDCLRVEKGFRAWGHELSPDITPLDAGLMFAVDMNKSDFIGKDALVAARERRRGGGVASGDTARHTPKRIVTLELEEQCRDVMPLGNEAITIDGVAVGRVTSAAYGFSVGAPVCLGLVSHCDVYKKGFLAGAAFSVEVGGAQVAARASAGAAFDKKNRRVKGDYSNTDE